MKTIKHIFQYILVLLIVFSTSCARSYEEPEFDPPAFNPKGKVIDVKTFKEMYASVIEGDNKLITEPYYVKARVVGNDISGNIFKQLYIQDYDSSDPQKEGMQGLYMGVDQSNVSNLYAVGQDVYVYIKDLYAVRYGGQLQIGYGGTNANRIPWETFQEHVHKNGFADRDGTLPRKLKVKDLTMDMANTLVQFDNAEFTNGGKGKYIEGDANYTEQAFNDGTGTIIIRTSKYFTSMKGKVLPEGKNTIVGILGNHNGTWQLVLRDVGDVKTNEGEGGGGTVDPEPTTTIFSETFGTSEKVDGFWPKVADFKNFDMKDVKYSETTGQADIRMLSTNANLWMPTKKGNIHFIIEGVNTSGGKNLTLSYEASAGIYNIGESFDLAKLQVFINGERLNVESKIVSIVDEADRNKFYPITIKNIPAAENIKMEFLLPEDDNLYGFRLDNIVIKEDDGTIEPTPTN